MVSIVPHMEISDVKRRVVETIERARRLAGERRTRIDKATREYEMFLDRIAIPVFKQVANVLRAEGYMFTVFTPGGSVRLMSDRATEDYVELDLDATGEEPAVHGHASRSRGRRVVESEGPIGPPAALTEEDVLSFLLRSLEPLVER
jgi:hypothetical protein